MDSIIIAISTLDIRVDEEAIEQGDTQYQGLLFKCELRHFINVYNHVSNVY